MLQTDNIRQSLSKAVLLQLDQLDVFDEVASTNSYLLRQPRPSAGRFSVAIAEQQTAGRGQRGNQWFSPPSSGIYLSIAYTFGIVPSQQSSLTLAMGVAAVQALAAVGITGVSVKWPNDLVACDGKAGGILTEVVPAGKEGITAVIGIGLNVDLSLVKSPIGHSGVLGKTTDLRCCNANLPTRSVICASLIEKLAAALAFFETDGFAPFHHAWQECDWLRNRRILVASSAAEIAGTADGIDTDGALLVRTDSERHRVVSGSVTKIEPAV